jgi:hypothetical protein
MEALMNSRVLVVSFFTACITALAGACSGTGESSRPPTEDIGQATAAISAVPPMVACIEIDVMGARSVTRRFDVMPGASAALTLTGLPLGTDTFVGLAYASACQGVMSTMQATWISDPVMATLVPQAVASVSLTLHPNGQANVGVGFQPDDAGTTCMMPFVSCSGVCVDTVSDPGNCGACGIACPAGSMCTNGVCSSQACMPPLVQCMTGCADLSKDPNNCGTCGIACPAGSQCISGNCACPPGLSVCAGACVNTTDDPNNCGACGHLCPMGSQCISGVCACPTGFTACAGACANLVTDPNNCGGCGFQCPAGDTCTAGVCTGSCIPKTCATQGFNCGMASDGCGNAINCGRCPAPLVCGGGGPNVCG